MSAPHHKVQNVAWVSNIKYFSKDGDNVRRTLHLKLTLGFKVCQTFPKKQERGRTLIPGTWRNVKISENLKASILSDHAGPKEPDSHTEISNSGECCRIVMQKKWSYLSPPQMVWYLLLCLRRLVVSSSALAPAPIKRAYMLIWITAIFKSFFSFNYGASMSCSRCNRVKLPGHKIDVTYKTL